MDYNTYMLNKENIMTKSNDKVLFIIDPQNDFIDIPGNPGSLAVPGAYADMARLVESIEANPPSAIVVSLDTHSVMDIAHKSWWVNAEGENPGNFTLISLEDVKNGVWKPVDAQEYDNAVYYLEKLAAGGKFPLCIWPDHCVKGTFGHEVFADLAVALRKWEKDTNSQVHFVYKGENPNTEHYSALKAEVVWNDNGYSELRTDLIEELAAHSVICVAGEAKSHCVANTVYDLMDYINKNGLSSKVEIWNDCMSAVPGFEAAADKFESWAGEQANMTVVNVGKKAVRLTM